MGLSNSTPVYDCVPSELFIQFVEIFNEYDILIIEFSDFFKVYPSKININGNIPFTNFINEVSGIFSQLKDNIINNNESEKEYEKYRISFFEVFTYNIILCIYQYYYFNREKGEDFTYKIEIHSFFEDRHINQEKIENIKEKYKNNLISEEIKKICLSFIGYLKKYRVKTKSENFLKIDN